MAVNGDNNTVRDVSLHVTGSYSSGYGNPFGAGRKHTVAPRRHSALLVTGRNNRVVGCRIISRAFGHGIFIRGAVDTLVKHCYVEGKMCNTDEILRGKAGRQDYQTFLGRPLRPHDMVCLGEDGIGAYYRGRRPECPGRRRTRGITVENCTFEHMRRGVALGNMQPPVKVTGCKVIECELGYNVAAKAVVEKSSADARYGPVLVMPPYRRGARISLRVLDSTEPDDVHPLARLNGGRLEVSLRSVSPGTVPEELFIEVGSGPDGAANNIRLTNRTDARVILTEKTKECTVVTQGPVEDRGEGNMVFPAARARAPIQVETGLDVLLQDTETHEERDAGGGQTGYPVLDPGPSRADERCAGGRPSREQGVMGCRVDLRSRPDSIRYDDR